VLQDEAVDALLEQARFLADQLSYAFDTPSGVPVNDIFTQNTTVSNTTTNGLAVTGTLVLEWTRLSDLLGDASYGALAQRAESYLLNPQPVENEPWPGLVGTDIYIENGTFADNVGGWNGGTDSFYEYLIKMYVYDRDRFATYKDRWIAAADSSIAHLTSSPSSRPDLAFLAAYSGQNLSLESGHLACFDGGNFILGGTVLDERKYIDFGLKLTEACRATYASTATHIGPESFSWNTTLLATPPYMNQTAFFEENGFFITSPDYVLRPEVIESYYYAYRVTKDPMYREWAWEAFQAIDQTTRANSGFSSVSDVNAPGGGNKTDQQESFLFAEVLKYSYLIFAEVSHCPKCVGVLFPG